MIDLSANPVIAAVKNEQQLKLALKSECETVFLLFGDLLNIGDLTRAVKNAGKNAIIHIDLVNGLSSREIAVDFIAKTTSADGIISTKPQLVKRAKELISLGAEKVIIGSAAWNSHPENGSVLNEEFLNELVQAIGKDRIIISVDAINGKIAVKGWTETIDISLVDGAKQAEKFCSELLFTCVEKEGCMQGTNMEYVKQLRDAVHCRVVVAGGVSSVPEIKELEKLHCDVQLGMALYTNKVALKDAFIACLDFEKMPMIPVIAQSVNGEVLMQGFANEQAFEKTFETGKLTFWSRSRNELWTKGDTSGNFLNVVKLRADCDRDCVLASVLPTGPSCHTGSWTCFGTDPDEKSSMGRLYNVIADRFANPKPGSYTATLDSKRVREKVEEEAEELCEAETKEDVIWEAADLLYFVNVLLYKEGVTWQDVYNELDKRHKK